MHVRFKVPLNTCVSPVCPAGVNEVDSEDPMICTAATCPGHDSRKIVCRIKPYGQCKAKFFDKKNRKVKCKCSYVKLHDVEA